MARGLHGIFHSKKSLHRTLSSLTEAALKSTTIPKGYFTVYVGEDQAKSYVAPLSYLNEPAFQELQVWWRKNLDMSTRWVDSQFPAEKTSSLNSLLGCE